MCTSTACSLSVLVLLLINYSTPGVRADSYRKVVFCPFFPEKGAMNMTTFDPKFCTHLIVYSAGFNGNDYTLSTTNKKTGRPFDETGVLENLKEIRNKFGNLLKLILGVNLEGLPTTSAGRTQFVSSVKRYLRENSMDGISVKIYGQRREYEKKTDSFVQLIKELSENLEKTVIVNMVTSMSALEIGHIYDIEKLGTFADYIELDVTKFGMIRSNRHYYPSPLGCANSHCIAAIVDTVLRKGAPPHKLVLCLPTEGAELLLSKPPAGDLLDGPVDKMNKVEKYYYIEFNTVCSLLNKQNWNTYWEEVSATAFAVNGKSVLTYDDTRSYEAKVDFALEKRLGGISLYRMNEEDWRGDCKRGPFPLLTAASKRLRGNIVVNVTVQNTEF